MKKWNKPEMMDLDTKCTADIIPLSSGTCTPPVPDTPSQITSCPRCGKSLNDPTDFHSQNNHKGQCPFKRNEGQSYTGCTPDCPVHH